MESGPDDWESPKILLGQYSILEEMIKLEGPKERLLSRRRA